MAKLADLESRPLTPLEETQLSIPETERQRVARVITEALERHQGHKTIQQICGIIVADLIRGNISPGIANAAKPYVEMLLTSITAEAMSQRGSNKTLSQTIHEARRVLPPAGVRTVFDVSPDGEATAVLVPLGREEA